MREQEAKSRKAEVDRLNDIISLRMQRAYAAGMQAENLRLTLAQMVWLAPPMRILLCSGRTYDDPDALWKALDAAHGKRPITLLIHSDCSKVEEDGGVKCGADKLA